jgi:putative aldouronate transport system permease protein
MQKSLDRKVFDLIGYSIVFLFAALCFLPFVMVISSSITSDHYILANGYTLLPHDLSLEGYRIALKSPLAIFRAYGVTILVTVLGTFGGVFINTMTGYVLQRKDFRWRNGFSFYFFFTTLFGGGLVPWYILCVRYLNLKNSLLALIVPSLVSVWNILIVKGFLKSIPYEITESAKMDGAGDFKIFVRLILPLAKPAVATIALFTALGYWNDWYACMLFITNEDLYSLQYLLYKLLSSMESLRLVLEKSGMDIPTMPIASLKMALTVIVTGPIIFLYPFVQKFFVKGLTIGAVKG